MPEVEPSEPVRVNARPLVSELASPNESVSDLKIELISVRLEAALQEVVKDRAKPLVCDPTRESDPPRDLNRDRCSARPELVAHESLMDLTKETFSDRLKADDNDVVRDRKIEVFSEKVEAEPIETDKFTVCPLKKEATRLNESLNDLK